MLNSNGSLSNQSEQPVRNSIEYNAIEFPRVVTFKRVLPFLHTYCWLFSYLLLHRILLWHLL